MASTRSELFTDHLELINHYDLLTVDQTLKEADKASLAKLKPEGVSKLFSKLKKLADSLQDILIGFSFFGTGKKGLSKNYHESILDKKYHDTPKELQTYFGNETAYKRFQTIHKKLPADIDNTAKAITRVEVLIPPVKEEDLTPATEELEQPTEKRHHKKSKSKHHDHAKKEVSKTAVVEAWNERELNDELFRFAASQFLTQVQSPKKSEKRLAKMLESAATLSLKLNATLAFRRAETKTPSLLEKIIISLNVHNEMQANHRNILVRDSGHNDAQWLNQEVINSIIDVYSIADLSAKKKNCCVRFFSKTKKPDRQDSLITFLKSDAALHDKRTAVLYYLDIKDADRLQNILLATKNGEALQQKSSMAAQK